MDFAFHLGQLVRIARSSSGTMDSRTYCIVGLLPSQGDPLYRVKSTTGIEYLVRQREIKAAAVSAVP